MYNSIKYSSDLCAFLPTDEKENHLRIEMRIRDSPEKKRILRESINKTFRKEQEKKVTNFIVFGISCFCAFYYFFFFFRLVLFGVLWQILKALISHQNLSRRFKPAKNEVSTDLLKWQEFLVFKVFVSVPFYVGRF